MNRTQDSINLLLNSLEEALPISKSSLYREIVSFIREFSSALENAQRECDDLKSELKKLQKQLDKGKKK